MRHREDGAVLSALRAVPLFEGVADRVLRHVADDADVQTFREGQTLMLEHYHGEQFVIVLEGQVEVARHGEHVATLGPGDFLGEAGLLDGGDRNATVRAANRVKACLIGADAFATLRREAPAVAMRIDQEAARRRPDATTA